MMGCAVKKADSEYNGPTPRDLLYKVACGEDLQDKGMFATDIIKLTKYIFQSDGTYDGLEDFLIKKSINKRIPEHTAVIMETLIHALRTRPDSLLVLTALLMDPNVETNKLVIFTPPSNRHLSSMHDDLSYLITHMGEVEFLKLLEDLNGIIFFI